MTITHHTPLVLASGSAIRAQILKACAVQFSVAPSNVDEDDVKHSFDTKTHGLEALALELAKAKTLNVSTGYPDHLTIGADQLCVLGEQIFDKPASIANAIQQLQQLSGKTHQQISAVCLARGEEIIWQHVGIAKLTMRELSPIEIENYIRADEPLKSCGSYKYESLGKHLFKQVSGNDDVIKGLPLQALIAELHKIRAISL